MFEKIENKNYIFYNFTNNEENITLSFIFLKGIILNSKELVEVILGKKINDDYELSSVDYISSFQNNTFDDIVEYLSNILQDFKSNYKNRIKINYGENNDINLAKKRLFEQVLLNFYTIEDEIIMDNNIYTIYK